MKPLEVAPEALDEMFEASAWYDDCRDGLSREFLDEAEGVFERICASPKAFPRLMNAPEHLGHRRAVLKRFPYSLVFMELETTIRIIAVAHMKREPGYWSDRVDRTGCAW